MITVLFLRTVSCYPALSERSNLHGPELIAQFSNAQAQHQQDNTVLESLSEFVPRFNDTWATTTALVLEDSVTLAAKLLMNSERESMVRHQRSNRLSPDRVLFSLLQPLSPPDELRNRCWNRRPTHSQPSSSSFICRDSRLSATKNMTQLACSL